MKKSILVSIACFITGFSIFAQGDWVMFTKTTPEAPIINLTNSDNSGVSFTVEVCGMYSEDIIESNDLYQRINIPSTNSNSQVGWPELPVIRQLIAIPECDDVILSTDVTGQTSFSNYLIYPKPDQQEVNNPDGSSYIQEVFDKDNDAYVLNSFMPTGNAEINSVGYLRDQKYAEVFIYPIQYNPTLSQIDVATNFNFTLSFVNPSTSINVNTGIFNNVASNTLLNYNSSGITASINDNVNGSGNVQWITLTDPSQAGNIVADYIIICADDFYNVLNQDLNLQKIADHRASYNGFDVAILNAENVTTLFYNPLYEPYERERAIREFLKNVYEGENALHTHDDKLGYVLLVGDVGDDLNIGMPSSTDHSENLSYEFPSDYYFSCLTTDGSGEYDPVGDLFIGRFCVDNDPSSTELFNMVEKTIFYETEYSFDNWRDNVINIYGYFPLSYLQHQEYNIHYQDFMNSLLMENNSFSVVDASYGDDITQDIIDGFNTGGNFTLYLGHGDETMWTNNTGAPGTTTINELQEGLTNTHKTPVVMSISCYTGYFDGPEDCLGEAMTSYSSNMGFVGFFGSARGMGGAIGVPISEPELIQEHLPYSVFHNFSFITGEFILESKLNSLISGESVHHLFTYLGDPALNIMAHGFQITQDVELPLTTTISTNITVKNGAQLTVPENGQLNFINDGCLIIEDDARLFINKYVTITGNSPNQLIHVKANYSSYIHVLFNSVEGTEWGGVKFDNLSKNYLLNKSTFENCKVTCASNKLTISSSSFTNSGIKYRNGDLSISNSNFDNSKIEATYGAFKTSYVEIKAGCTIQNCEQEPAICIDGYYNYTIDDCTISGNDGDGIGIFNSGDSASTKIISNNIITNNGWGTLGSGIVIYHSYVRIYGDQLIEGNKYGISCFNNSNISIRGNSSANYVNETQIIRDNNKYQVYATQNSFPYDIQWNAIIDEDNQYHLVYYAIPPGFPEELDVRNNYWGSNFTPSEDLYPFNNYIYQPIWDLNSGGDDDDAEAKYNSAQANIVQEDYTGAKADFQQIINDYPTSKFAQAALRELFSLEEYATDDYASLKVYYNTEADIQNNPDLAKLAEYLTNFCEIKLENYPTAISWFENVIQNPETIEDSIFAIIDLGYTYFLMENGGLKSSYSGNLVEHIPESKSQFVDKRDYLLSLLYKDSQTNDNLDNELTNLIEGEVLQNFPNPFSGTTKIWYKLENESIVQLDIYNYAGQLISSYIEGTKSKGNHHIDFDASGLKNGIYFYSISINGQITDSKKMTIMK